MTPMSSDAEIERVTLELVVVLDPLLMDRDAALGGVVS